MGAADDRPDVVKEAEAVLQKRAGAVGRGATGSALDGCRLFPWKVVDGGCQRGRFHRKEGNVPATVVTSGMTGKVFAVFRFDLPADEIHLGEKVPIVAEEFIKS